MLAFLLYRVLHKMNSVKDGITIIGLGPGDARFVTREAWGIVASAEKVFVRTVDHPVIPQLPDSVEVIGFDDLYVVSADFEAVYTQIIATILEMAQREPVIYAVPGHPYVGEATVSGIVMAAATLGIDVHIVAGLSFVEPVLTAVGYDGMNGLQLFDAIDIARFDHPPLNPDTPVLLGQVFSRFMAAELKLALMRIYTDEHPVYLVHAAGGAQEFVENIPLHAIDRSDRIRNLTCLYVPPLPRVSSLAGFAQTIAVLRGPDGCPWDREQTPQSMRAGFIEEVAEVIEALDAEDVDALRDELGDVLLHIVFQAQMAAEADEFTLAEVVAGIDAKIKRRHPHVWGDAVVNDIDDLVKSWEAIKAQENSSTALSALDNISGILPALARAQKIQQRVGKVGFDWPTIDGTWKKLDEEIAELQSAETPEQRHAELGDILFAVVNVARWLKIDAEIALRDSNERFATRFRTVERLAAERGSTLIQLDSAQLDSLWQEVKKLLE